MRLATTLLQSVPRAPLVGTARPPLHTMSHASAGINTCQHASSITALPPTVVASHRLPHTGASSYADHDTTSRLRTPRGAIFPSILSLVPGSTGPTHDSDSYARGSAVHMFWNCGTCSAPHSTTALPPKACSVELQPKFLQSRMLDTAIPTIKSEYVL